jgi:hypothetical protein
MPPRRIPQPRLARLFVDLVAPLLAPNGYVYPKLLDACAYARDNPALSSYLIDVPRRTWVRPYVNGLPVHWTTRLVTCAARGNVRGVRGLLARGAHLDATGSAGNWSPLMHAVHGAHADVARLLLRGGANPRYADKCGVTAMHLARTGGMVKLLATHGAPTTTADCEGETPLHAVLRRGLRDAHGVVRRLLRYGADATALALARANPFHDFPLSPLAYNVYYWNEHAAATMELMLASIDASVREAAGGVEFVRRAAAAVAAIEPALSLFVCEACGDGELCLRCRRDAFKRRDDAWLATWTTLVEVRERYVRAANREGILQAPAIARLQKSLLQRELHARYHDISVALTPP